MKKIKSFFIMLVVLIVANSCNAQQTQSNIQTEIIATWVAEEDTNVKLVFNTQNKCLSYYNNNLIDTFSYSITNTCGTESDLNNWFLKLADGEDSSERCYELYGANFNNNQTLSMRDMSTGKIFIYNKQ